MPLRRAHAPIYPCRMPAAPDPVTNYRFTDSVSYLLNRVGVRLGERFSIVLKEFGLTVPMYRVLAALRQEGDQRLGDLAAITSIEQSTLSRLVTSMRKDGLVTRIRPKDNGRAVATNLTAAGRTLAERLMLLAVDFEQGATSGLGADDLRKLKSMLRSVYDNLIDIDEHFRADRPSA